MALYEHIFLARQDVTAQQVEALTEQMKGVIQSKRRARWRRPNTGASNPWLTGSRRTRRAHFTLMNIDAPAAAITEMERQMRINEDVIRLPHDPRRSA